MPDTSGTYSLPPSYRATRGQTIRTEQHNPPLEDIAQALTRRLPRDGSAPMNGNLPMNGNRVTNMGAAIGDGDAVRRDQVTLYSAFLDSIRALSLASDGLVYATGAGTSAATTLTAFGRSLIGAPAAADARASLGLGTASTTEAFEVATITEAEAGTDNAKIMTPLRVSEFMSNDPRVWRNTINVKNVTYRNTTGRSIHVSISASGGTSEYRIQFSQNGSTWITIAASILADGVQKMDAVVEIPNQGYYRQAFGDNNATRWAELS